MYRARLVDTDAPANPERPSKPPTDREVLSAALAHSAPLPSPASEPRRQPNLVETLRAAPLTTLIIAINVLVFALAERSGSTSDVMTLIRFGAVNRTLVWQGEYWRLVTSMFLHIGVIHLVWNGYYGFRISAQVEKAIGSMRFVLLYLMTGVAGSAASVIGHQAVAAGASGALFGLIGWEVATLRARFGSFRAMWDDPPVRRELSMVGAWFVLGAFAGFDNYAHGGGLVFGLLFTWALVARAERRKARFAVVLLAFAALVTLSLRPLPVIHEKDFARWNTQRANSQP